MISKSDIVILVLASSALGVGIYRWHQNTQDVNAITIPASSRVVAAPASDNMVAGNTRVIDGTRNPLQDGVSNGQTNQVTVQTIPEQQPVSGIVVSDSVTTSSDVSTNSVQLGSHRVRSGDYLGKIAQQYGTDVNTLREINGISGSIIQIGQEILYPL